MKQITNENAFNALTFADDANDTEGYLSQFKTHYVTKERYEFYTQQYEERSQGINGNPLEYIEIKRYLFQKAGE